MGGDAEAAASINCGAVLYCQHHLQRYTPSCCVRVNMAWCLVSLGSLISGNALWGWGLAGSTGVVGSFSKFAVCDGVDAALAARMAYDTVWPTGGLTRKVALAWQQVHVETLRLTQHSLFVLCSGYSCCWLVPSVARTACYCDCICLRHRLSTLPAWKSSETWRRAVQQKCTCPSS